MRHFGPASRRAPAARSSTSPRGHPAASTSWRTRSVVSSGGRWKSRTWNRAQATYATRGRTSRPPSASSVTDRASTSRKGSAERSPTSVAERIKVVRVIARLNVGGPALHVAYLTEGLADRGYDTTLVAGSLARGEESMAHVAQQRGAKVVPLATLHREISPLRDAKAVVRLARLLRAERPEILHTHTAKAGAVGRFAALLAGDARPPIIVHTYHGHVLRGYFNPLRTQFFRETERALARHTTRLIAVGPEVRDDLVDLNVAPYEKFSVIRLGIDLKSRVLTDGRRAQYRQLFGVPENRFVVGWIGRMTGIKRVPDVLRSFKKLLEHGVDA